ncbi:MAG: hypothetical protein CMG63_04310 [Candidatus Marinimicrobia bacterium]|nr:hypothetical protein [Candidatus Neomarinimicrobiota bacterium]
MKIASFISIVILFNHSLLAECSDLDYADCIYWSDYCEWDDDTQECFEIGGSGDFEYGPYNFGFISEEDGLRNGPAYLDGILYYPLDTNYLLGSIIFTPGFGGGSSTMLNWGEFFASHGFISMVIGPNDEINDSHEQRALGLLDAIQTIKAESWRVDSPLNNLIDTTLFIVAGYSMGGGASQIALMIESIHNNNIVGAIALNPTILIEDCDVCTDNEYCICLAPEFLEHDIPTLVVAGQNELDDLSNDYAGLMGQDIYFNTPETTMKILYEIGNGGHSSAESPAGYIGDKTLEWVQYLIRGNESFCDSLLVSPENASSYLTTIQCGEGLSYDLNGDGVLNDADFIFLIVSVLNSSGITFDINFDQVTDIFDILNFSDFIH